MEQTWLPQVAESSGCLARAVFFLVHPLTHWLAQQTLDFLCALGDWRSMCARQVTRQLRELRYCSQLGKWSGAEYGVFVSFHWLPTISQTLAAESIGNIDGGSDGDNAMVRGSAFVLETAKTGDQGKVFGVVLLSKKLFQTSPGASPFGFQVRWGWTFLFPLFTLLRYEKNMRIVGLEDLSICFDPWRERLEQVKLSVDPATEVWNISCGFILYHRKEFQYFRCLQSSRVLGMSIENSTRLLVACGSGLLVDGCKRIWTCARRGFLPDMLSEEFREWDVDTFARSAGAAQTCEPCLGLETARVGSRQMISIRSVFLMSWVVVISNENSTKKFILNCMEPCVVSWSLIHQVRAPPAQEVPLRAAVRDGDVLLADVHTREPVARAHLITSCVCGIFLVSRQRCLDSFHPRVVSS